MYGNKQRCFWWTILHMFDVSTIQPNLLSYKYGIFIDKQQQHISSDIFYVKRMTTLWNTCLPIKSPINYRINELHSPHTNTHARSSKKFVCFTKSSLNEWLFWEFREKIHRNCISQIERIRRNLLCSQYFINSLLSDEGDKKSLLKIFKIA